MKSRDQELLEEAYRKVVKSTAFKDKKGNYLAHGDQVVYSGGLYKVVGGKSILGTGIARDELQIEPVESEQDIPKLLWVKPSQVIKT
jgi:hypothetical protein